jgi:hypothetical protein
LLYGNTQFQAYTQDMTVGLFMVDATETTAGGDNVHDWRDRPLFFEQDHQS